MVCSDGRPRLRFCLNRFVVHKAYLNLVSQLQTVQRTRGTVYVFLRHYNIGGVNVEKNHMSLYDEVGANIQDRHNSSCQSWVLYKFLCANEHLSRKPFHQPPTQSMKVLCPNQVLFMHQPPAFSFGGGVLVVAGCVSMVCWWW